MAEKASPAKMRLAGDLTVACPDYSVLPVPAACVRFVARSIDARIPLVKVLLRLLLGPSVFLLEGPDNLLPIAIHTLNIIVGKFSPFLLKSTFDLFPFSFHFVTVHRSPRC